MAATVDQKLLKTTKFPPSFNEKVDMQKVNIEVMKKWIASRISEIIGTEDDVVTELCFNLLESSRYPNIKALQIQLTGFLEKDTPAFCKELWDLCLSAQSNAQGVPKELLEAKKLELIQEKIEAEKAAASSRARKVVEADRERDVDEIRQRERSERGRERGRYRGGRGGRDFDRPAPQRSRSPPSYRSARREVDTYIPESRGERRSYRQSPPRRRDRSRSRSKERPAPRRRAKSRSDSPERSSPRKRRRSPSVSDSRSRSRSRTPPRSSKRRYSHSYSRSPRRKSRKSRSRSRSRSRSSSREPTRHRRRDASGSRSRSPKAGDSHRGRHSRNVHNKRRNTSSPSRSRSPRNERRQRRKSIERYDARPRHGRSRSPDKINKEASPAEVSSGGEED